MVERIPRPDGLRLMLTPNRSLSWHGNVRVWLGLLAISAIIATGFSLAGAWVIIPFAGLELIALASGIYFTSRACQRQEVVTINDTNIHIEKGMKQKQAEWTLPRRYARLRLEAPVHPFAPAKLSLTHRDTNVPLGQFLNIDDTAILVNLLESSGVVVDRREPDPQIGLWF
ncbi:DUF2244 domain-containing protein [Marinobacter sp.]|uniref:DUF2244 domain-containing protein n=1 Tax=Marinobacter sp. TaxID=50741 RepID=UPI003A93E9D6